MRSNLAMGVRAGVTISFPTVSPRSKAGLGLIADPDLTHDDVDRISAESGPEIMAVANMMHLKVSQLPQVSRHRSLTPRQREALVGWQMARPRRMWPRSWALSVAMVEKHLRLARETLDVDTTAQAVAKATLLNQIFHHNRHFVTGDS